MKLIKWLLVFVVILTAILALGWYCRNAIIQFSLPVVIRNNPQQAGITLQQLEIQSVAPRQASLSAVDFDYFPAVQAGAAGYYHIVIHGLHLFYHPQIFFNHYHLDKLTIDDMQISRINQRGHVVNEKNQTTVNPADKLAAQSDQLRLAVRQLLKQFQSNWRKQIPVNQLVIRHFQLHGFSLQGNKLSTLNNQPLILNFNKIWTGKNKPGLALQLLMPSLNKNIELMIYADNKIKLTLDKSKTAVVNMVVNDSMIKLDYQLNIYRLSDFLKRLGFIERNKITVSMRPVKGKIILPTDRLFANDFMLNKHLTKNKSTDNLNSAKVKKHKKLFLFTLMTAQAGWGVNRVDYLKTSLLFSLLRQKKSLQLAISRGSFIRYKKLKLSNTIISNPIVNVHGRLIMKPASARKSAMQWVFDGNLSTKSLLVHQRLAKNKTMDVKLKKITTAVNITHRHIAFNGYFSPQTIPARLHVKGIHHLNNNSGSLNLDTINAVDLSADNIALSQIISPWHYPFDLLTGKIGLKARANWAQTKPFALSAFIKLDNAGGEYGEMDNKIAFSGLNTRQNLTILPDLASIPIAVKTAMRNIGVINLAHLDAGVLISHIHLKLLLSRIENSPLPLIKISNLYGHLFAGEFSSHRINIDFNQSVNSFHINVKNIDLTRIPATQQFSDLAVSGKLNGRLPIKLTREGVFVHHGYFDNAGRKGYIRYTPKTGQISANPLSGLVLKALRDFEYNKLVVNLTYVPDGDLKAAIHLNGISPELGKNQRVNININTEQNVKALLKSLRYAEGLDKRIDAQIQKRFNEK